ncbi:hypothetical protein PHMEG_00015494 [Phytophthora megakarya]|uniref:Uncharacterized protein n=1 Tax=Phytophthora megakarya TaxID=4795 RepID=A0A225W1A6_9STRA|nr:hypothetical protein PHMEG_00015494 [Phytophthora megakarya]
MASSGTDKNVASNYSLQWLPDTNFEWLGHRKVTNSGGEGTPKTQASLDNIPQDLLQLPGPGMAANLNINSWKDNASLSKLLYRFYYPPKRNEE